jgi:hypothetical protein
MRWRIRGAGADAFWDLFRASRHFRVPIVADGDEINFSNLGVVGKRQSFAIDESNLPRLARLRRQAPAIPDATCRISPSCVPLHWDENKVGALGIEEELFQQPLK